MSDPLPEDPHGIPEPDARVPAAPPEQVAAPSWNDEPGIANPTHEQLLLEAQARQALREAATREADEPLAGAGFTVQRGGRNAMAETAGRIGAAVGNAQREVRRRLELVRRPEFPSATAAELAERSAHLMTEIDLEVADLRHQAARKLEDWSGQAEQRLNDFRKRSRVTLRRSTLRAQELAEAYPLQTIAAIAGTFFLLGMALRLRRSHRG